MPWSPEEAEAHTKKADTPALRRLWAQVANKALAEGRSDASAIRIANAAIARHTGEGKRRKVRLI